MADLILFNANVITMDPSHPTARIVAAKDGRISAVVDDNNFEALKKPETEVIDCGGRSVLPGFIDAHLHFHGYARSLIALNLEPRNNVRSIADIEHLVEESARTKPPGSWITGRGYNEFYLAEGRHPTRWDLDRAAPLNPVKITHRSGQAHLVNSVALRLMGITDETGDPPGGLIDRDPQTGRPTGLLFGMGDTVSSFVPGPTTEELHHAVGLASKSLAALGITSFHDASSRNTLRELELFRDWCDAGLLLQKVKVMLGVEGFEQLMKNDADTLMEGYRQMLGGIKIILHEITGDLDPAPAQLARLILRIHEYGFQSAVHAFEERAIRAVCMAVEKAQKRSPGQDSRHRVEHCSICPPALAKRLASLGIVVVTQPPFTYYNGERYLKTVAADELKHLYPIGTLVKNGVMVAGSSDCPVVPANPLVGVYSAVSRTAESGDHVLLHERIEPYEALQLYTTNAAAAAFEERSVGSISMGKRADFVVLSNDPTKVPVDAIREITVSMTIIDGKIVYDNLR